MKCTHMLRLKRRGGALDSVPTITVNVGECTQRRPILRVRLHLPPPGSTILRRYRSRTAAVMPEETGHDLLPHSARKAPQMACSITVFCHSFPLSAQASSPRM